MDNCIFQRGEFVILKVGNEFIVVNKDKTFRKGHTHIKSFNTAEYLVNMARYKRIPRHLSTYLLTSLIRISQDEEYISKLNALIAQKGERKQKYYNRAS